MPNFTSEINQIFAVQPTAHRIMLRTANDLGGEPKSGRFFACFTCYCVGPYLLAWFAYILAEIFSLFYLLHRKSKC